MKRALVLALAATMTLGVVATASASSLTIFLTGLDMRYDHYISGGSLYDAGGTAYAPAEGDGAVDALFGAQFVKDGSILLGNPMPAHADVEINGLDMIPLGGGTDYSDGTGIFDLYFNGFADNLLLNWDSPVEVNYNAGNLVVTGSAVTSSIAGQGLPFGLTIGTPVTVSFSQQVTYVEGGDYLYDAANVHPGRLGGAPGDYYNIVTYFESFGTGEVTAPLNAIPEPGTMILLGTGLLLGARRRMRR